MIDIKKINQNFKKKNNAYLGKTAIAEKKTEAGSLDISFNRAIEITHNSHPSLLSTGSQPQLTVAAKSFTALIGGNETLRRG